MNNRDELFNIARTLEDIIPDSKINSKDLFQIKKGSFLEYNDKTFYVKETINYQERKNNKIIDSWDECEAICLEEDGNTYFVEVDEDDGLKIYFSHTVLKIKDLNIKKNELKYIVENEEYLKYDGVKFYYEDDYKAYISNSDEQVYFIDFEDENGNYLTIEKYEDSEFRAYISSIVNNVKVIKL